MEIGLFCRSGDEFTGWIRTLTIKAEARFLLVFGSKGGFAPSHMLVANDVEIGAAWPKTAGDFSVLNVRLDDPVFPVPVAARLTVTPAGDYVLSWIRPSWRR
jgi:uncharacterized protein (DUF736 family)